MKRCEQLEEIEKIKSEKGEEEKPLSLGDFLTKYNDPINFHKHIGTIPHDKIQSQIENLRGLGYGIRSDGAKMENLSDDYWRNALLIEKIKSLEGVPKDRTSDELFQKIRERCKDASSMNRNLKRFLQAWLFSHNYFDGISDKMCSECDGIILFSKPDSRTMRAKAKYNQNPLEIKRTETKSNGDFMKSDSVPIWNDKIKQETTEYKLNPQVFLGVQASTLKNETEKTLEFNQLDIECIHTLHKLLNNKVPIEDIKQWMRDYKSMTIDLGFRNGEIPKGPLYRNTSFLKLLDRLENKFGLPPKTAYAFGMVETTLGSHPNTYKTKKYTGLFQLDSSAGQFGNLALNNYYATFLATATLGRGYYSGYSKTGFNESNLPNVIAKYSSNDKAYFAKIQYIRGKMGYGTPGTCIDRELFDRTTNITANILGQKKIEPEKQIISIHGDSHIAAFQNLQNLPNNVLAYGKSGATLQETVDLANKGLNGRCVLSAGTNNLPNLSNIGTYSNEIRSIESSILNFITKVDKAGGKPILCKLIPNSIDGWQKGYTAFNTLLENIGKKFGVDVIEPINEVTEGGIISMYLKNDKKHYELSGYDIIKDNIIREAAAT